MWHVMSKAISAERGRNSPRIWSNRLQAGPSGRGPLNAYVVTGYRMPGRFLVFSRDPHTRQTARGATAAPRGMQPILVETVCAEAAALDRARPSGSGVFRSEQTFPKTPRRPPVVLAAAVLSLSGTDHRALHGRPAGRFSSPAGDAPGARVRHRSSRDGMSPLPGQGSSARVDNMDAGERLRQHPVRLCRRRVIYEKGNAGQCTP